MGAREFLDVDPATLHVPSSRRGGADPYKLQRQIAKHGTNIAEMPPIEVSRGTDGELVINNGVIRSNASRSLIAGHIGAGRSDRHVAHSGWKVPLDRRFVMTGETSRDELLSALAELGRLFPDWRMGQTLANLAMASGHSESGAVWDLEDSEALAAARRLIDRNAERQANEPNQTFKLAPTL